ncbi:tetratricopeptide repeat protein [Algibacter sp. 2305UL17-15]|uniref:ATP-binding protein n=1 Tax=Algibacter sp. 2305UL17-15 TaxID=3231268 RepID=UPI0034592A1F
MQKPLFVVFIFLNFWLVQSQNINHKNDSIYIDALIKKGDSLKKTNYESAASTYNMALAIALDHKKEVQAAILYKKIGAYYHRKKKYTIAENQYRKGLQLDSLSSNAADLYFNTCLIKQALGQHDSILPYLETSLDIFDDNKVTKAACNTFLNAGTIYLERQFYDKALKYLIKAYNGYEVLNDKKKLSDVCSVIGNVQNRLRNYHQALNYYQQILQLHKETNSIKDLGMVYANMANTFDNLKLQDSAVFYYKKSIHLLEIGTSASAKAKYNLAGTYKTIGQLRLAENYFKESIREKRVLKDTLSMLYGYNGLASLYLEEGALLKAKSYLDSLAPQVSKIPDQFVRLNFYENKADYYSKSKNYKKAFEYQIKHNKLYEKIYDEKQALTVQNLQAQFEYATKENEILKLKLTNSENELKLNENNKSLRTKNVLLLILGLLSIALIISYYLFRYKQKNVKQALKIEKLEAVYDGQEIIKKRIARDLHDIITTNFDGLRLRILALKRSTKINEMIDDITDELKSMNQQIRTVSHRLYPLEMYMGKQKFTNIIKSRLGEFQLYGNVFVELENQLPEVLNKLPLAVQNNFYGILLEVLNNVEKHALATKISIKNFKDSNNNLHFVFEDNGIGIETNYKEGIGLLNIKQRVEILEGSCKIGKTEFGTQVHINFPIHKA